MTAPALDAPPDYRFGPVSRTDLVRYAGASGDFNPLHHDETFARAAGLPGVMAHGMFSAGLLGSFLIAWIGERPIRRFKVRFLSPVWPGDTLHAGGNLVGTGTKDGRTVALLALRLWREDGADVVTGEAEVECADGQGRNDQLSLRDDTWKARPHYARWLRSTNNITQQFLAIGGIPDIISLAGGLPAAELYPVEEIRQASDRALTRWGTQALEYGPVEGFPALRQAIAERISKATGGAFGADNVLITSGAAQGLDLIGKLFIDRGDLAVVQHPTYLGALDAWRPREPHYEKLTWDLDDPDFEARLKAAKFVYAVPNYSNPTGVLVPEDARERLLGQVADAGTWLVEDDPYLPLQLDGKAGRSMLSMHAASRRRRRYDGPVIYLGTLSKSIVPGLRVGWIIAPADLVQALALAKQSSDLSSSMLTHVIALALLESGFENDHVEKTVAAYRQRRDALMQAAALHLSQWFEWDTPPGGMFAWLSAKSQSGRALIDTDRLYHYALAERVAFVPSSVFDFEGKLNSAMRVNFTRSSPEAIGKGIARLRRAVERYLAEDNERSPVRTAL